MEQCDASFHFLQQRGRSGNGRKHRPEPAFGRNDKCATGLLSPTCRPAQEPTKTCADDPSVCPSQAALAKIDDLELWAEGAAGDVTLDIAWIIAQ